ncbi:ABC transporter ATP-binding protein [Blautia liquoris]|uniref:ABC transporter ATP-binding protein n=2 Tax=Blautia liquoris TaxID=2779518 RepID=A0A7M2RKW4_9FIRM|nr:ABC transporter ATP-binding protein [Blautia liquoris]
MMDQWPLVLMSVLLAVSSNYLALLGPRFLGNAIDAISDERGVQMDIVMQSFWRMLICYVLAAMFAYLLNFCMVNLSQRITYRMRKQLFENLTTLPISYFDTHTTGDIISRISYDVDTVNETLSSDLVQVLASVYTVFAALYFMIKISKPLILVFAVTVPISVIFTRVKAKKIHPLFRKRSRKLGELNGYAEEMLSGAKTIGVYDRAKVITDRFDQRNKEAVDAYYDAEYYGAMIGPTVNFINNLSLSLIMIFGGILYLLSQSNTVAAGSIWFITIGGVTQFVMYSRRFTGPINEFANIISEFQSTLTASERIFRIIDEEPEKADKPGAKELTDAAGEVELDDVKFGYNPDKTIIHGLSIDARPGQTVAIVGPTGAGKTTIINLLMRFYDVNEGEIFVDGNEIRDMTRDSLRGCYTMVLQDTWLFYGTILDNIIYGNEDATMDEVIAAAKAARIHSYIEHLPDGYQTILSDDGVNISKGQKQLITIARAMLPKSRMLILDEATSNVDSRTEFKIQEAMALLMKNRTNFVVAHRLSTIKNADKILVIKDGDVIEQGTHEKLLKEDGFYAKLYNSQYS